MSLAHMGEDGLQPSDIPAVRTFLEAGAWDAWFALIETGARMENATPFGDEEAAWKRR